MSRGSVDDGFQRLLPVCGPHRAVELMIAALRDNSARLWCNDVVVDPNFIRTHLVVRTQLAADGRWSAKIEPIRALDGGPFTWQVDLHEIDALKPSEHRPEDKSRKRGSRNQEAIKQTASEKWPHGYESVETGEIIKAVGDSLKARGIPVPKRDTFLRALGRRKG
jgi:hypothetical protein